jgi:hypothetical protein
MPKPKLSDLASFQEWLINTYSITNKSASVYASRVRKILRELEEINDETLSEFIDTVAATSSLDLFLSSWNKFKIFLSEEKGYSIPKAKRPSKEKRIVKVKPHNSMLELAHFLKNAISITYTRMLTFAWKDVKTSQGSHWEIIDPLEFGTYYKVPRSLLQNVANYTFGDYPIDPSAPIFLGNIYHKRKLSRSMISTSLQDFQPTFKLETPKPEPSIPVSQPPVQNTIREETMMIEEIEIPSQDSEPDIPDILNDYSMFDPDKF